MTNSQNSELTQKQKDDILVAYIAWLDCQAKMEEYMQSHRIWIDNFNTIWDNEEGDGPMWAEFERLRDG